MLTRLFLLVSLLFFRPALAVQTAEDFQTWAQFIAQGAFKKTSPWLGYLELQGRFGKHSSDFARGFVRPALGYQLTPAWSLWLGYAYVPFKSSIDSNLTTIHEHRIFKQAVFSHSLLDGSFSSRTRLELRFLNTSADKSWRLRQLFRLAHPLGSGSKWSGIFWDEVFISLNSTDWSKITLNWGAKTGLNANRSFLGLAYNFTPKSWVEVGYLNQYTPADQFGGLRPKSQVIHAPMLSVNLRF
jgi:lipopolysaccharide assembly outer membrane protein LptD (OstA)